MSKAQEGKDLERLMKKTNIESLLIDITELGWYVRISKPDETKPKDNMQKRWKLAGYPMGLAKDKDGFTLGCFDDSLIRGLHRLLRQAEKYPTSDETKMAAFREWRDNRPPLSRVVGSESTTLER